MLCDPLILLVMVSSGIFHSTLSHNYAPSESIHASILIIIINYNFFYYCLKVLVWSKVS